MTELENENWTIIIYPSSSQEDTLGENFKYTEIQNRNYLFCNEEYNIFINSEEYCLYAHQLTKAEINHSEKKYISILSLNLTIK